MPGKKTRELKNQSESDLKKKLSELRNELIKLNAQASTGTTPKNPGLIRGTKKSIATIPMISRENGLREIGVDDKIKENTEETQRNG